MKLSVLLIIFLEKVKVIFFCFYCYFKFFFTSNFKIKLSNSRQKVLERFTWGFEVARPTSEHRITFLSSPCVVKSQFVLLNKVLFSFCWGMGLGVA